MSKTMGQIIRELRKQKGITQEELAEIMYVTPQAISKWERDIGYPDIVQIVPLADAFGVSTDVLLNHEDGKQSEEIEQYMERDSELAHKGFTDERVSLWREAIQKYPQNYVCLIRLANSIWTTLNRDDPKDIREANAKEVVAICERIIKNCTDNKTKSNALQLLVMTYGNGGYSFANEEKAVEYATMADGLYTCQEMLLKHAYFTKEGKKEEKRIKQRLNLDFIDLLSGNIVYREYDTDEDKIFACETALKIWNALFYDGNFLFYHCRIAFIHSCLARCYAKKQNKDKTIENLKQAYYHAKKYDEIPEKTNYTSIFFSSVEGGSSGTAKNYTETDTELFLNTLNEKCYDFIREDNEFKELLNK